MAGKGEQNCDITSDYLTKGTGLSLSHSEVTSADESEQF